MECVSHPPSANSISLCWWSFCRHIIPWISHSLRLWKCRLVVPKFDVIPLELIPMLVGFFTYKAATFVETFKEILPKSEEDDSDIWDRFGPIHHFFSLHIHCEGKLNASLSPLYNSFCCVLSCHGPVVAESSFRLLFGYWRTWGSAYTKVFNLCSSFECTDLPRLILHTECNT